MTDINLVNEGGVIKRIDRETGEEVPVTFDDLASNSQRAGRQFGDTRHATLIAYKDDDEVVVISRTAEVARDADAGVALTDADAAMSSAYHLHITTGTYTMSGTYSEGALWAIRTPGTTVTGEGKASEIRWDPSSRSGDDGARLVEIREGADGVSFRNLFINGRVDQILDNGGTVDNRNDGHNVAIIGSDDFSMIGCYSWLSPGDGVEPGLGGGGNGCVIAANHFYRNWEQNVHLNGCNDNAVVGNVMEREVNNSHINTFTPSGTTTQRNTIVGNTIRESTTEGITFSGTGTHKHHVVSGNVIYNNGGPGIFGVCENATINNNVIANNGGQGVRLTGSGTIADNVIRDNATQGVRIYGSVTVTGNRITGSGREGVHAAGRLENTTIADNIIANNAAQGIKNKYGGKGVAITGNTVRNNGDVGVLVSSENDVTDGLLVSGNVMQGNATDAIRHVSGQRTGADHTNVLITNNAAAGNTITTARKNGGVMDRSLITGNLGNVREPARLAVVYDNYRNYNVYSSPPPSPMPGAKYLDDGTNRADGNVGPRVYDGAAWVDIAG